jgi:nucleoside-diphosphate-sugar epimerase
MILVTGGTGLVGAHLLIHLVENGDSVRASYRNAETIKKTKSLFSLYNKELLFEKVDWIQADIIDVTALEIAFENIEYVYHCAALISFDTNDENLLRKINIEGTANIVNFCIAKNIKKLCFFSSIAALGDLKENEKVITEESEWNPELPHSDYAISKYGAEMEIWRGQQEGLKTVILNPGVILGPGFPDQGSGQLFKRVASGLSFYTEGVTGFIAVPDVVRIAVELMKGNYSNGRFTVIAENIGCKDLLFSIADSLSVKRPSIHAGSLLVEIAYRIDWFLSTVFGRQGTLDQATAKASNAKNYYSNEKIKKTLGTEFIDIHQYIAAISKL